VGRIKRFSNQGLAICMRKDIVYLANVVPPFGRQSTKFVQNIILVVREERRQGLLVVHHA
jgi:hypothetical protein